MMKDRQYRIYSLLGLIVLAVREETNDDLASKLMQFRGDFADACFTQLIEKLKDDDSD